MMLSYGPSSFVMIFVPKAAMVSFLGKTWAGTESLGMMSLMEDLGVNLTSTLRLDASAALGILQRKGVEKIRHLDVGCLWFQEKEAREQLRLAKEPGETNLADQEPLGNTREVRHISPTG